MGQFRPIGGVVLLAVLIGSAGGVFPATATEAEESGTLLPGAPEISAGLRKRLDAAQGAKGTGYRPRTEHLREDGSPEYVNRLILETSPYLLQHAHNPVNWFPWGDEAFAEAERLGRPVLLSVGYSTCHWCHVMERESFEDEELATYLNSHYIAIKVDREERPDLDSLYMRAVQMLTGRGGWPMTVWLTPEREPFFGGTYFPARDGDRGSRKGFLTLLHELREAYDGKPDSVAAQAKQITARLRRVEATREGGLQPGRESLDAAVVRLKGQFDPVHGGRKGSPKFPSNLPIRLLWSQYGRTGDETLREMARFTLSRMAGGGIHDQIGGGFHRYATDERWLVPHFEKMLYDNALLAVAYLEGHQVTGREEFASVARGIARYVAREMTSPVGAFYSATDADSSVPGGETEEGWFFTWTPAEIDAALDPREARYLRAFYGVSTRGNFEGRNILHVARPAEEVARRLGVGVEQFETVLQVGREKLYAARSGRSAPLRDEKILTSWNGLMISALARCGFVLDEPDLVGRAAQAASFLLRHSRRNGRLLRSFKDGEARHAAYVEDYSFLIAGLLDLYEATGDADWLREAGALQEVLDEQYRDPVRGGYYRTGNEHEALLARERPARDGAEPSGNSVALMNLLRLHSLTLQDAYRVAAEELISGFGPAIRQAPTAYPEMLLAVDFWLDLAKEIVVVTPNSRREAGPFLAALRRVYLPNKLVVVVSESDPDVEAHSQLVPLIQGKVARKGRTTAYVCERGACRLPTSDVEVFAGQLGKIAGGNQGRGRHDR